jgi:hypothetical protein
MLVRDANRAVAARSFDERRFKGDVQDKEEAKEQVSTYHNQRDSWVQFCLFPDLLEAQRMPSMFPVPTHVIRRQRVFNLSLATAGQTLYCLWMPETVQTASPTATLGAVNGLLEGQRMSFLSASDINNVTYGDNNDIGNINASTNTMAPPISAYAPSSVNIQPTNLAHGGVRLIGAFCELEYVGTVENHSGMIEVGLHLHAANDLVGLSTPHLFDSTEIIQAPFYRKFRPMDGCRVVWFPIDNQDFEFQDYATDYLSRNMVLDTGVQLTAANATATTFQQLSNAYGPLKKTVRPEWAINLSGLQVGQAVRVHMCAYYETIPDEGFRDLYMPRRTNEVADPAKAKSLISTIAQHGVFSTPAKTAGIFPSVVSAITKLVDGVSGAMTGFGMGGIPGAIIGGAAGLAGIGGGTAGMLLEGVSSWFK